MSHRIEIKVVIHAADAPIAEKFASMVEDYISDTFTKDTAVMTVRIEPPLDTAGLPSSEKGSP